MYRSLQGRVKGREGFAGIQEGTVLGKSDERQEVGGGSQMWLRTVITAGTQNLCVPGTMLSDSFNSSHNYRLHFKVWKSRFSAMW